ncbi:MAG TPA: class I SAM-dependent methyltransferase, partial [Ktedonobacteraceae bacterium]|nr:class I SAM-dependent methyltransferase [Ktedonobacteraceae bacterium]
MKSHDYEKYAIEYTELGFEAGTYFLAFRVMPHLLQKYVNGKKALDYGCGSGRSTRFLKSLGFDTVGVDISHDMLEQAQLKDTSGDYHHIQSGQLLFDDLSFDLIFSSFVLLEVPSLDEIEKILAEMKRVLKQDGSIIIITSPTESYQSNMVSFSYDFPENKRTLQSGDTVKFLIQGTNIILYDYYWTEQDYEQAFNTVGLRIVEILKPLGQDDDPIEWLDEKHVSP